MKGILRYATGVALMGFVALAAPPTMAGEIKVGAGAAPTENVLKPVKDAFEKASGVKLFIISSGPKNAWQDLEKGSVDAAAAGVSFEDWGELMKKEGAEIKEPGAYQKFIIGSDRIAVLTHKDNPVKKLDKDQLKGIFSGKTANWKDVGGKDVPIIVIWGSLIPGTNKVFTQKIMDGAEVTKDVLQASDAVDVRQNVAANPEAVGIGPVAILDGTINSPETPEASRPITLITKGEPSPDVKKLLDFIAGEGQSLIKK